MRISTMLGSLAVLVGLVLPAAGAELPEGKPELAPAAHEAMSQEGAGGAAPHMRGMREGWRGHYMRHHRGAGERPIISLALKYRQELGLSPAQVEALDSLRTDFQRDAIKRGADIRVAELDLRVLVRTDPADLGKQVDLGKAEAKVREIERLRAEQRLARIRTIEQGKAQLTPEQRTKLGALLAEARHHWQRSGPPAAIPRRF
jgi:Spy/CpxP family protein refolding chaperone